MFFKMRSFIWGPVDYSFLVFEWEDFDVLGILFLSIYFLITETYLKGKGIFKTQLI